MAVGVLAVSLGPVEVSRRGRTGWPPIFALKTNEKAIFWDHIVPDTIRMIQFVLDLLRMIQIVPALIRVIQIVPDLVRMIQIVPDSIKRYKLYQIRLE